MADGCLLLVDAFDGPMPQTRFVLRKAFAAGVKPIVVINKVDRPEARPMKVLEMVYDLFIDVGANDEQIDFPYVFSSGKEGWASNKLDEKGTDIRPIFDMIMKHVPGPECEPDKPFSLQVMALDYSDYVGRIAIGRIQAGQIKPKERVLIMKENKNVNATIETVQVFEKLGRTDSPTGASAGDIIALIGVQDAEIGDTIANPEAPVAQPRLKVDEPTLTMLFRINDSPFVGRAGKYVTSRNLRDRLERELLSNVALRVEEAGSKEEFFVSGRGLLHLGILIETMRREGYELSVGKPKVIYKEIDGVLCEPIEHLVIDTPADKVGAAVEVVGSRRGELKNMVTEGVRTQIEFLVPARV